MRTSVRLGLFAVFLALPVAVIGCGGDDDDDVNKQKVEVEDWVADMCKKAQDFDDAQTDAVQPLVDADESDPEDLKAAIDSLVRNAGFANEDFVRDVERIGIPDINGGEKVVAAFRQHQKDEQKILEKFKSDVNKVDLDEKDYADQVYEILDDVEDNDLRDLLEKIDERDVDDLIDLIDENEDCSFVVFDS
ncbi:MAG: hypothetical protein AB7J35_05495 [Dehalococcoidia bacterium]